MVQSNAGEIVNRFGNEGLVAKDQAGVERYVGKEHHSDPSPRVSSQDEGLHDEWTGCLHGLGRK
jgi:hypothetical protein